MTDPLNNQNRQAFCVQSVQTYSTYMISNSNFEAMQLKAF